MLDFGALICILKPMTCINCSIDLLYLIKTSIDFLNIGCSKITLCLNPVSFFVS